MTHTITLKGDTSKHYSKQGLVHKTRLNDRKVVSQYVKFIGGVQ